MATEVSVLDKYGDTTYYSNYADAITDIINSEIEHPLVQIWADLDEQIILLDGVDIWIAPGVTISKSAGNTITDNNVAAKCNIYGEGNIKNSGSGNSINISHGNSKLNIVCNFIENSATNVQTTAVVVTKCEKFHLRCNKVISNGNGLWIGFNDTNMAEDLNLEVENLETGNIATSFTGTSLYTNANGFLKIDEILCKKNGHCFRQSSGTIIAEIRKFKSIHVQDISTVHIDQGTLESQKLSLYFDEILNLHSIALNHHQGSGMFIGRNIFSKDDSAVDMSGNNLKGYVKCNKIISENKNGVRSDDNDQEIVVNSNYIEGHSLYGCIYLQGDANILIKNAKLFNNSSSDSRCLVLEKLDNNTPNLTLNNVKSVTGNLVDGSIIFLANFDGIDIKNYSLFTNIYLDPSENITLLIGKLINYLYITNEDLT
ncbi:MAG: hypothetical protein JSS91_11035 [Bacteroidetes bacterium]|nr:hypothetical protein [Bacteroidota bacterium]